jgi:hypothetical protein
MTRDLFKIKTGMTRLVNGLDPPNPNILLTIFCIVNKIFPTKTKAKLVGAFGQREKWEGDRGRFRLYQ